MAKVKADNARVPTVCHVGFNNIAYSGRTDRRGQVGCTMMDAPPLGAAGVHAGDVVGMAGLPELGYANGRPMAHTIVSGVGGGLARSIATAPYGSGKIASLSSYAVTWMANNFALTTGMDPRGLSHSAKSVQNTMSGPLFVLPAKVAAIAYKTHPGAKRTFLSSGQHHSWDRYAPARQKRRRGEPDRNCSSMHHVAGAASLPAVHAVRVFGKNMCERCFERAIKQTRCVADLKTHHGQIRAAQSATDLMVIVTPEFAEHLKKLLTKFQWWMAVACMDVEHFACPVRQADERLSMVPMEMHAAAIMDHPLMFAHLYRVVQHALVIDPKQPVKALRQNAVALVDLPTKLRASLALNGFALNREADGKQSTTYWVPKNKAPTASTLRWETPVDVVQPHVGLLVLTILREKQQKSQHVVTREYARVVQALMTGLLTVEIELSPPLASTEWRVLKDKTRRKGKASSANRVPPFRIGPDGRHIHTDAYLHAEELSWDKLHSFLKHHIDLASDTLLINGVTKVPPLHLRFAGSLTLAVARVRRTYGKVTVASGSVFEQLVNAAVQRVVPGITAAHGQYSDPLAYAASTDPASTYATSALEQEIAMLRAGPEAFGRFDAVVASLHDRCGIPHPHNVDTIDHTPPRDRADLWACMGRMNFASENNAGNLGFDRVTRKLAGIGKSF